MSSMAWRHCSRPLLLLVDVRAPAAGVSGFREGGVNSSKHMSIGSFQLKVVSNDA